VGLVSTLAGTVGVYGSSNGLGTYAGFYYPIGISSPDSNGNIYVADYGNHLIRKINRYHNIWIWNLLEIQWIMSLFYSCICCAWTWTCIILQIILFVSLLNSLCISLFDSFYFLLVAAVDFFISIIVFASLVNHILSILV
jgi:hypothetical protein